MEDFKWKNKHIRSKIPDFKIESRNEKQSVSVPNESGSCPSREDSFIIFEDLLWRRIFSLMFLVEVFGVLISDRMKQYLQNIL